MPRPPAPLHQLRDLELLIKAHHPIIFLETIEEERAEVLLEQVARDLSLVYATWTPHRGLTHPGFGTEIEGTREPARCLEHIVGSRTESLFLLKGFLSFLGDVEIRERLKEVHTALWRHRGAVLLTGGGAYELPDDVVRLVTTVALEPPTDLEYHQFLNEMLRLLRERNAVAVKGDSIDVGRLIKQLRGLTFFEVHKVMTQAIAESWTLDRRVIKRVLDAKKEIIRRSGVLEYTAAEETMYDVAGLVRLKKWLRKRKAVFANPEKASEFGLSPPKGLMLLGVPGCGKSLSAKAVASEYGLPLVRLDPGKLYTKYVGDTEKNLRRAIQTAESMAPVVLWIDEIEKAFQPDSSGADSGVSQRVFGTFLSWMQDKAEGVFVIATCNDITGLPPELLRKGRFDEIFFIDLPSKTSRQAIFAVHLGRRKRDAAAFDLAQLAEASEGFSGAEIEQAIVAALYAAYAEDHELTVAHILTELRETRPLSVTMAEKIAALRAWAKDRTLKAD